MGQVLDCFPHAVVIRVQVDLGRQDRHVAQHALHDVVPTPASAMALPTAWRSMCGVTRRESPARVDSARNSSSAAPGLIGAPSGWRNRLTNTKSQASAPGHPSRSAR